MSAPKSASRSFTSLQLETASGPQICPSWSRVRQVTGLLGLSTTVRASLATVTSSCLTPPVLQAASSSDSIVRDASLMSVSPAQNFSNPPPVPAWPTEIWTSGFSSLNCSATASVSGPTVLEPSIRIDPERLLLPPPPELEPPDPLSSSSPHAVPPSASASAATSTAQRFELRFTKSPSVRPWQPGWLPDERLSGEAGGCYWAVAPM